MISSYLVFVLNWSITFICFPISINALILKIDKNKIIADPLPLLFSFALAPYITSLLLHYLLWLFPYQSSILYVSVVIAVFTFFLLISKDFVKTVLNYIWSKLKLTGKNTKGEVLLINNKYLKIYQKEQMILYSNVALLFIILVVCFFWVKQILFTSFEGHDMLEYAIQARHFAREKLIEYIPNRYHIENNFFYVGLHGFSFPLIGTWEYLFSEIFGIYDNDYLLRSVSGYYCILIFVIIYTFIKKYSQFVAISVLILMFSNYGLFITLTNYHIDSYRIFMIIAAFTGLALSIKSPSAISLILFGVFAAAQAYIHSLGVFIALFLCLSSFIFYPGKLSKKVTPSFLLLFIIMLFGGIHYIVDVFWGTGWIFQEIRYY
jgi:hypothetical protein